MSRAQWLPSLVVALLCWVVTSLFFIDLCDLIYRCGCDHLWAGAAARCNIHNPSGRHCPWCAMGTNQVLVVYLGIVGPQVLLAFRPRRWHWSRRLWLALAAFPAIGGLEGLAVGLFTGYWNQ